MAETAGGLVQNRRDAAAGFLQRWSDPGYRLPGENPTHATLDESRRWVQTYDLLINFKRELLELCQRFAEQSAPQGARAIRDTDMILLEVQISRFRQKRDFWKIRAAELEGNGRRGGNH